MRRTAWNNGQQSSCVWSTKNANIISIAKITGFGYYAERAEVDGFTYYNTSLSGKGDRYPDPHSEFLQSEDSYILLTFTKKPPQMTVEIKGLDGKVLDRKEFGAGEHK